MTALLTFLFCYMCFGVLLTASTLDWRVRNVLLVTVGWLPLSAYQAWRLWRFHRQPIPPPTLPDVDTPPTPEPKP